ncbi:MAG: hypothetical protein HOV80_17635 [Polyangiaceae bacterium]|nr:hypothetical protein [Polyangiaceae bacterium]
MNAPVEETLVEPTKKGWTIVDLGARAPHVLRPRRYIMTVWPSRRIAQKELDELLAVYAASDPWRRRIEVAFFDGRDLHGKGWQTRRRIRNKQNRRAA